MADNVLVKDGIGQSLSMRTTEVAGIHTPHQIISGYDSQDDMVKVKSVQKKFRDSFGAATLDSTKWTSSIGTGGSVSQSGGSLVIGSGTTINSTTSVISNEAFTVPFRLSFQLTLSQRIANQTFYVEVVSVDVLGEPDGLHSAGFVFDGTSATQAKYSVQNGGITPLVSAASTIVTTAGTGVYELEPFADECWFHSGTLDATSGRANSYRRHQQIPDPNQLYKIRLRWLNGGTAPASNTNASLQFVACQDYAELTAEITAGRGQVVAGQSIGVAVTSIPTTTVTGTVTANTVPQGNLFYNESTTAQAASATVTGTSRDVGVAAAAAHRYTKFNAFAFADQDGTLRIECSNDNTTWRRMTADTAVSASTPVILSVPVMTRYHRVVYVNGATLQGSFMLNSSYTAA